MKKFKAFLLALLFLPAMFLFVACDETIDLRVDGYQQQFDLGEEFSYGTSFTIERQSGEEWKNVSLTDAVIKIKSSDFDKDTAGTYEVTVTVTYKDFQKDFTWSVTVNPADTDFISIPNIDATYGQTLADLTLPDGYTWQTPTLSVGDVTGNTGRAFVAIYQPDANHNPVVGTVYVVVNKADTQFVTLNPIYAIYGQYLYELALPNGYNWVDSNMTVGDATQTGRAFAASYLKDVNHNVAYGEITIIVSKQTSVVNPIYTNTNLYYGMAMPEISTSVGDTEGTITWDTTTLLTGSNRYNWTFVPTNPNYTTKTGYSILYVSKAKVQIPTVANLTYNGLLQTAQVATSDYYTMSGTTTAKDCDTYSITLTLNDTDNYMWSDNTSADIVKYWSIQKADLTMSTNPTIGELALGYELNTITITGGAVEAQNGETVEGTFQFVNPDYIPTSLDDNTITIKFVHNNPNYNQTQFEVEIQIYEITFSAEPATHYYVGRPGRLVYKDRNGEVITNGDGYTIEYSTSLTGHWSNISIVAVSIIGKHDFYFKVTYDTGKYYIGQTSITTLPQSIDDAFIKLNNSSMTYNFGEPLEAGINYIKVGINEINSIDYDVEYSNNTSVGTATVTVTAKGQFAYGTCSTTFAIKPVKLHEATITIDSNAVYYPGAEPKVTVKFGNNVLSADNYTVQYQNNSSVGTATIFLTGKNNATSTASIDYTISTASLEDAEIIVGPNITTVNDEFRPEVTVKIDDVIIPDSNYDLEYSENTDQGIAYVTVTGKNSLTGTKTQGFLLMIQSVSIDEEASTTTYEIYQGQDPTYNLTVNTMFENYTSSTTLPRYQLKTYEGEDLDNLTVGTYDLYFYLDNTRLDNNTHITVTVKENKPQNLDINDWNFKFVYLINETIDNFNDFGVTATFTDGTTKTLTYSKASAFQSYYVTTDFDSTTIGTYSLRITAWDDTSKYYDFDLYVVSEKTATGILPTYRYEYYTVGTPLAEMEIYVYKIYNNNNDMTEYWQTITFANEGVQFVEDFDINSLEQQEFSVTLECDGNSLTRKNCLFAYKDRVVEQIRLKKDGEFYDVGTVHSIVVDSAFDFEVYAIYKDGTVLLINEGTTANDYTITKDWNTQTVDEISSVTISHKGKSFVFNFKTIYADPSASLFKLGYEDVVFDEDGVASVEFSQECNSFALEIQAAFGSKIEIELLDSENNSLKKDTFTTFADSYLSSMNNVFDTYTLNVKITYMTKIKTYTVTITYDTYLQDIKVNYLAQNLAKMDDIIVFADDKIQVVAKDGYNVYINDQQTNTLTITDQSYLVIEIKDENENNVFEYTITVRQHPTLTSVKVNDTTYSVNYLGQSINIDAFPDISEYSISFDESILQNIDVYYTYTKDGSNVVEKRWTKIQSLPLTFANDTDVVTLFYMDSNSNNITLANINFVYKSYINSITVLNATTKSITQQTFECSAILFQRTDFISVDLANKNYTYKIFDADTNLEFDTKNYKNTNNIIIKVYDSSSKLIETVSGTIIVNFYGRTCSDCTPYYRAGIIYVIEASTGIEFTLSNSEFQSMSIYNSNSELVTTIPKQEEAELYTFVVTYNYNNEDYTFTSTEYIYFQPCEYYYYIESITGNEHFEVSFFDFCVTIDEGYNIQNVLDKQSITMRDSKYTCTSSYDQTNNFLVYSVYQDDTKIAEYILLVKTCKPAKSTYKVLALAVIESSGTSKILTFDDQNSLTLQNIKKDTSFYVTTVDNCNVSWSLDGTTISQSEYITFQTAGVYTLTVTATDQDKTETFTVDVQSFDQTPLLALTIGDDTFTEDIGENGLTGDFKFSYDQQNAKFEIYLGENDSADTLNVSIASNMADKLRDHEGNAFADLSNINLQILEANDKKYCMFKIQINTQESYDFYLYLYDEVIDIVFTVGDAELKFVFDASGERMGDFSLNDDEYIFASLTPRQIGLSDNSTTVDVLAQINSEVLGLTIGETAYTNASQMSQAVAVTITTYQGKQAIVLTLTHLQYQSDITIVIFLSQGEATFTVGDAVLDFNFDATTMTFGDFQISDDYTYLYTTLTRNEIGIDAQAIEASLSIQIENSEFVIECNGTTATSQTPFGPQNVSIISDEMGNYIYAILEIESQGVEVAICIFIE